MQGDEYFTIHVTPQVECAWVSFETNLVLDSHIHIIAKVLSIFKPGSFTVSLFMSKVRSVVVAFMGGCVCVLVLKFVDRYCLSRKIKMLQP